MYLNLTRPSECTPKKKVILKIYTDAEEGGEGEGEEGGDSVVLVEEEKEKEESDELHFCRSYFYIYF